MTVHNHGWLQKVSNDRLFSLNLTFLNFSQYPHMFSIIYVFLLNKLTFLPCISSLFISTVIYFNEVGIFSRF